MPTYWVIVARGQQDLLRALTAAFSEHDGFTVIEDRRGAPRNKVKRDRRVRGPVPADEGGFLLAERREDLAEY